jgi:hypothetical protein
MAGMIIVIIAPAWLKHSIICLLEANTCMLLDIFVILCIFWLDKNPHDQNMDAETLDNLFTISLNYFNYLVNIS